VLLDSKAQQVLTDLKVPQDSKEPRASKALPDLKERKEQQGHGGQPDNRARRASKEPLAYRDPPENKEPLAYRDPPENKEQPDFKELLVKLASLVLKALLEYKERRGVKVLPESKGKLDRREKLAFKGKLVYRELPVTLEPMARQACRERRGSKEKQVHRVKQGHKGTRACPERPDSRD